MKDIKNDAAGGRQEELEVVELRASGAPGEAEGGDSKDAEKEARRAEKARKKAEKEARKREKAEAKRAAQAAAEVGAEEGADPEREAKGRKDSHKVTFEAEMTPDEATNYLEALLRGVYAGKVTFRQGDGELELSPGGAMNIKVKASRKGPKEKIQFELGWQLHDEADLAID